MVKKLGKKPPFGTKTARLAQIKRVTGETDIDLSLKLDGSGKALIQTRIPFFDHMLHLFSKHAVVDLELNFLLLAFSVMSTVISWVFPICTILIMLCPVMKVRPDWETGH